MQFDKNNIETVMFYYLDQIKILISPETWENVLMECSKNELLILLLLYRRTQVNMSQIAEYINVPLNTATGIVARMEKKRLVNRERSLEDKRVVTIVLSEEGINQIQVILNEFMYYGQKIMESLSTQELSLVGGILEKVFAILKEDKGKAASYPEHRVRKITIQ